MNRKIGLPKKSILSPTFSVKNNIQHFFKFVYTFLKKCDKIFSS